MHSYVILTATATTFLATWHGFFFARRYRNAAGIKHPNAYAPADVAASNQAAYLFNCAQRAHGNYLENLPSLVVTLLLAGLRYPVVASGMGALWCVARVVYAFGYVSPGQREGRGRIPGLLFEVPQFGLGVMSALVGWGMLGSSVGF